MSHGKITWCASGGREVCQYICHIWSCFHQLHNHNHRTQMLTMIMPLPDCICWDGHLAMCSWSLILSWVMLIMSLSWTCIWLVYLLISQRITNILCPHLYKYVAIIPYFDTILKTKFSIFNLSNSNWAVISQKERSKYYGFQEVKYVSTSIFLC